jgi:hypothetical protein
MTPGEFSALVNATSLGQEHTNQGTGRALQAACLHLVHGLTQSAAATKVGCSRQALSQLLKKIPKKLCPTCHQPIKPQLRAPRVTKARACAWGCRSGRSERSLTSRRGFTCPSPYVARKSARQRHPPLNHVLLGFVELRGYHLVRRLVLVLEHALGRVDGKAREMQLLVKSCLCLGAL